MQVQLPAAGVGTAVRVHRRYVTLAGPHRGMVVEVIGAGTNYVSFRQRQGGHGHERERIHKCGRAVFERMFALLA